MRSVYIAAYRRTPIGKYGGWLSQTRPDDLMALVIRDLAAKNPSVDLSKVDDVIIGCANQAGEDNRNIARFAALLAGLPVEVPGVTVNRLCASGMQSVLDGYARISSGLADMLIVGGVESMSRAPYVMPKAMKPFDRGLDIADTTLGWRFINPRFEELYHPYSMGETAENIVERWSISREAQDAFALASHRKYIQALEKEIFREEIIPFETNANRNSTTVQSDQAVRRDTSLEKLAQLKPAFRKDGSVTAGNSSGINDGAAALLLVSEEALIRYGLTPLAKIVSGTVAGVHPDIMGTGPVPAIQALLQKNNLVKEDIAAFEINEAYAVQVLYCIDTLQLDPSLVNVNGGAVAMGHPLGMSGARITGHLALELRRRKQRYGIAAMCVGVGQGMALLLESVND